MDEGLTLKMCTSLLNATIAEATDLYKMNTTSVSAYMCHLMLHLMFLVMLHLMFLVMLHLMLLLMLHLMFLIMWHLMFSFDVSFKFAFNVSFHVSFLMFLVMFLFIGHVKNHFKLLCHF